MPAFSCYVINCSGVETIILYSKPSIRLDSERTSKTFLLHLTLLYFGQHVKIQDLKQKSRSDKITVSHHHECSERQECTMSYHPSLHILPKIKKTGYTRARYSTWKYSSNWCLSDGWGGCLSCLVEPWSSLISIPITLMLFYHVSGHFENHAWVGFTLCW